MDRQPTGVVLMNLGGPRNEEEIAPFLTSLLSDPQVVPVPWPVRPLLARKIARRRSPAVAEHYRAIGGSSPIEEQTRAQVEALELELGDGYQVRHAFRHMREFAAAGIRRVVALPAYPQWSQTTSGSAVRDLGRAARPHGIRVREAPSYPEEQGFILALTELVQPYLADCEHLIISAHGLPERIVRKGDRYVNEVCQTARALAVALPEGTSWSLAFQSRLGRMEWTRPYLTDEIRRLGEAGVRSLVVVPVSFACENLETLYELDIETAELARSCGIEKYQRVPAPGCHRAFIHELAQVARRTSREAGWEAPCEE
jgi:ferrochelatase